MDMNLTDEFSTEEIMVMVDTCVEAQLKGGTGSSALLYLESMPGIGKTQMVEAYQEWKYENGSEALGLAHPKVGMRTIILSQSESVDFGAPAPDFKTGTLNFLVPNDVLGKGEGDEDNDINIVFWDELPNASAATLAAWQSVAESGEIRGRKKATNCVYLAAGNRPEDKCGARPLPRSIREGRIVSVPMGVSMDRLIAHAEDSEWDPRIQAMLQWSKNKSKGMFDEFDPNTKAKVQPTPRGIQKLNVLLDQRPPENILNALAPGCVGDRMWAEIRAFFYMQDDLPSFEEIVQDPEGCIVPGDNNPSVGPSGQYAVISNCAYYLKDMGSRGDHVSTSIHESFIKYFDRMSDEMTLFGLKICANAHPDFCKAPGWGEAQVKYSELTLS